MDGHFGKVMGVPPVMVKDFDTSSTSNGPNELTAVGNTLFFEGYDPTNEWALWKSDGNDGTVMVKDTYSGTIGYGLSELTAVGNSLFFEGYDLTNGWVMLEKRWNHWWHNNGKRYRYCCI